jgi:hypothetical protein
MYRPLLHLALPLLLLAMAGTTAALAAPAASSAGERSAAIRGRLSADAIFGEWRCWKLRLDSSGLEVDPGTIPGGQALPAAATLYALDTGDFDVSLRDLADGGYWPYAFPAGTDLDRRILSSDSTILTCTALGDCWWLDNLGTADWRAAAKAQILLHYAAALNNYLAAAFPSYAAYGGEPALEQAAHSEAAWTKAKLDATQGARSVVEQPLPAFFTNPYTGQPMLESAAPGDYQLVPLAKVLPGGPTVSAALNVRVLSGTLLPEPKPIVSYTSERDSKPNTAPSG